MPIYLLYIMPVKLCAKNALIEGKFKLKNLDLTLKGEQEVRKKFTRVLSLLCVSYVRICRHRP